MELELPSQVISKNFNIKAFDNSAWRQSISPIVRSIHHELDVITPFGFELLENKKYLSSRLKKFYFYIGVKDKSISTNDVAHIFSEKLLSFLETKNSPFLSRHIAIKIEQSKFIKLRAHHSEISRDDKLIDIQCRYVETSILDDYCNYVICCLSAIQNGCDEIKEFHRNKRFRSRSYQLYVMMEALFGHLIQPMNVFEKNVYRRILSRINNSITLFFNDHELLTPSDQLDHLLMDFMKIRVEKMLLQVKGNAPILIRCKSFHVEDELQIDIAKRHYENAIQKIKKTYLAFQ